MSTSDADKEFEETLAKLKESFATALVERVTEIEDLGNKLTIGPELTQSLEDLVHLNHRLAGSAASYGYEPVSDAARHIEETAQQLIKSGLPPEDRKISDLKSLTTALRANI